MPNHWTYEGFTAGDDLLQGDILEPIEALRSVFQRVHPHFLDPKYTAFMLATQSCDMAMRGGRCGTKYLSIAVVRPLEAVLHDLLSHVCGHVADGVYLQETKGEAHRLLTRLFNQNEQALGLFYLHPDLDAGIAVASVALLRVTVTLRVEHYPVLRQARRGRLGAEFRDKLGWLIGNLYSRIGTQDWSEPPERKVEVGKLVQQCVDAGEAVCGPVWVPKAWVAAAKDHGVPVENLQREQILSTLEAHKPPEAKAAIIHNALRVLRGVLPQIDDETLRRLRTRLENDPLFATAIRDAKSE